MQPPASLAPGAFARVDIRCLSGTTGLREALLQISSNDDDENPFEINVRAQVYEPGARTHFRISTLTANGAVVASFPPSGVMTVEA